MCGVALLSALVAMSLAGSGYACGARESHLSHMAAAEMPMGDMPMDMPMDTPGHDSGEQSGSPSDCSFPWSLGACDAMASCAPNAMAADISAASALAFMEHDEPSFRVDHLRSVSRSPESPPPRA